MPYAPNQLAPNMANKKKINKIILPLPWKVETGDVLHSVSSFSSKIS